MKAREVERAGPLRLWVGCIIAASVIPAAAMAQDGTASLRGVVFDSTSMAPLGGARVAVLGTTAATNADADGRFEIEGIPPGSHWVSFFHPRLQTLGVSPPSHQVVFRGGETEEILLAVPSDRTLLMGWCMAEQPGPGFGALAGVVTDSLTGVAMPGALVTASPAQGRPGDQDQIEVRADDTGYFRMCTLPAGRDLRVQAHFGRSAGRSVHVTIPEGGAQIHDLILMMSSAGTLKGRVLDYASGNPLAGAVISILGTGLRQVTDSAGTFALDSLPPGRHLVTTEYLGYEQRTDSVTVFSQETVNIEVRMATKALELEGLVVTARSRFGETKSLVTNKREDVINRAQIEQLLTRVSDARDLLREMAVPGLSIRDIYVADASGAMVPGVCVEMARANRRGGGNESCAQVAVFLNDVFMPYADQFLLQLNPNIIDHIEVLSPADAMFQFGDQAPNGAIMIYTR
jgi:CarboxypepD_reg-like domain/Carboxypeptidase regulatory-like domain/TonB-dependent Receptor Plug Domain